MAFEKSTNNRQPKADAFINAVILDAMGNEHRLRKGIPLELTNLLERSIINLSASNIHSKAPCSCMILVCC